MHMIRARRRMSGFTLISTLVGLAVGLLSIAAMLTMYRDVASTAHFVQDQSRRDGQVASGSLVSQQEMQQAGFGIAGAAIGTDLVVLSNALLSGDKLKGAAIASYGASVNGNAVIWGFNPTAATGKTDPAGYQCEGLLVTSAGLQWLKPTNCKNAANWQSVSWQISQLATTDNLGPLSIFQAASGSCFPYQQTSPGSSFQVSYYLPTEQQVHDKQSNGPANASDSSSTSSGGSGGSGDSNKWYDAGHRDGVHPGNGHGNGDSSGSSGSDSSSGSSGSSDSSSSSSSSDSSSTSSAVKNIPAFSVCLPNFKS